MSDLHILVLDDLGIDQQAMRSLMSDAGLGSAFLVRPDRLDSVPKEDVRAIITVRTPVGEALLGGKPGLPNVGVVAVAFTGYDAVDLDRCRERGAVVCNVPSYASDSVVELTVALAISLLRDVPRVEREMRAFAATQGDIAPWWKGVSPGRQLAGKTVGIVGTGTIGCRAAEVFAAMGCRLLGWSRTEKAVFKRLGGAYVSTPTALCVASDIVSLHVPLSSETRGLIGGKELQAMRPGTCLINASRGPIVDKVALLAALKSQEIRVALDVFDQEPLATDDPLLGFPEKTILTPHIGFRTREALMERARQTFENIRCALDGKPQNVVN
ncbi:MAG: hydroxyacid dehydrogenase [Phycisphaerae bacterium]|nr:hydroxyacid dehydrogenase [Phycisphaerae bacterium]